MASASTPIYTTTEEAFQAASMQGCHTGRLEAYGRAGVPAHHTGRIGHIL
jgi:hypothetical protein